MVLTVYLLCKQKKLRALLLCKAVPGLCVLGGIKRFAHRENYNSERYYKSYKFIYLKQTCTLSITHLNLVLGVTLTHLHHLSAFMQASSVEPPAISASTGTRNRLIA